MKKVNESGLLTKLCKSVDEGGIRVRDIGNIKSSLHMKFAW